MLIETRGLFTSFNHELWGVCSITSLNIVGTHCAGVIPAISILGKWSFGPQEGGLSMLFVSGSICAPYYDSEEENGG